MNEEFGNNFNNEENIVPEPQITVEKEEPVTEEIFPAETAEIKSEDVPEVEAQVVEEPESAPYTAPVQNEQPQQTYYGYTQGGSQQYGQQQYAYQNNAQQQSYYAYPQPQPENKPKKEKKGMKTFISAIALILVFALGFGVASISKHSDNNGGASVSDKKEKNDGPKLNINESPITPTKVSSGGVLTTAQIAAKLRPSNVGIVVYTRNTNASAGEGSGIVMGEDATGTYTYIITCAHVISDAGVSVRVQTEDGTTYDAEIAGFDTRTDIGVIKIKAKGLPAAEFGDSSALVVGDPVYAIGNPGGVELFGSFTSGYVSSIDRPVNSEIGYTMKSIQHSAAISPGNSGGMLVNAYGQVIGINSQKIAATDYEGIGFAIPITSAKPIIEDLINYSYVPNRPKLGITYYPVSASAQYSMIAQIKGLPAGTLIINEISPDGSLANTEARQYDMIIAVNGKPLTTADVLLEKIDNGKVGDKMTLTLCRVNSNYSIDEFEVEVTLVEDKGGSEPITTTQAYYVDPFEFYFEQFGF
ncbi:MAG: trypsin-like peptidase domain-containing protein [Clostridia bacterium]|nr:trypsin-like peptidase domain-containing protein [Clostridia bacterium]